MPTQIQILKQIVQSAISSLKSAETILAELDTGESEDTERKRPKLKEESQIPGEVIEGFFDGQSMIGGPLGKKYAVPANYASKSKLVEGDRLKLTITPTGAFVYKQIGPIERKRLKGILMRDDDTAEWKVLAEDKLYKILMASVTYFKGDVGDEAIILVPKDKPSAWAACENIVKKIEGPKEELLEEPKLLEKPETNVAKDASPAQNVAQGFSPAQKEQSEPPSSLPPSEQTLEEI